MQRLLRERSGESGYMPRNFSELKGGGTIPMLSPTLKNGGTRPPRPPPIKLIQPGNGAVRHDGYLLK